MATKFETITGGNYPSDPVVGQCVYNEDTGGPEWWDGNNWLGGDGFKNANILKTYTNAELTAIVNAVDGVSGFQLYTSYDFHYHITPQNRVVVVNRSAKLNGGTLYGMLGIGDFNPVNGDITLTKVVVPSLLAYNSSNSNFGQYLYKNCFGYTDDLKVVAVGAPSDKPTGVSNEGSITIFDFDDNGDLLNEQIVTQQALPGDGGAFGGMLALSDDGLMVVSGNYRYAAAYSYSGSVEVFERSAIGESFTYTGNVVDSIPGEWYKSSWYWGHYDSRRILISPTKEIFIGSKSTQNMYGTTGSQYRAVVKAVSNGDGTFTVTDIPNFTQANVDRIREISGSPSTSHTHNGYSLSLDSTNNKLYITNKNHIYDSQDGIIAEFDLTQNIYTDNYWFTDAGSGIEINSGQSSLNHVIPVNGVINLAADSVTKNSTIEDIVYALKVNEPDSTVKTHMSNTPRNHIYMTHPDYLIVASGPRGSGDRQLIVYVGD